MPFGLTSAPAVFQAMINDVLRDFLDHFVYVYLDDILIYSPDPDTHHNHVTQVLKRLLENHLCVKAEKSVFHADTVPFLGFIVAPESNSWDLLTFTGSTVRGFSAIAAPLHALTSTQVQFRWFPKEIVADRGPQFVSRFWRQFQFICAKASLSSGYQPATGNRPPVLGLSEPLHMEQTSGLSRVCAQFIAYISHWLFSL